MRLPKFLPLCAAGLLLVAAPVCSLAQVLDTSRTGAKLSLSDKRAEPRLASIGSAARFSDTSDATPSRGGMITSVIGNGGLKSGGLTEIAGASRGGAHISVPIVPEPSSLLVLGTGLPLLGLFLRRRLRR